jgi:hypothetical protein
LADCACCVTFNVISHGHNGTPPVTAAFDPTKFNFVRLEKFQFPGGVAVYEYKNHPAVSGNEDFCA